jgi:catechol 2,3-dioxygenase
MLHAPWPLRDLTLKVLDLPRQIAFYQKFGFRELTRSDDSATLAAGDTVRLTLQAPSNLQPRPPLSAGLFHFAILVPDRPALGSFLRNASRHKWNFVGSADHLVSEALYFSDPEDNGIEVYADRPRESWQWAGGRINMATLPLDLEERANLPAHSAQAWRGFPSATRLGHMHLTVTNLDVSQTFYESLGLKLTANWGPFRFLAYDLPSTNTEHRGLYHHHVAINLAAGHHASPVSPHACGLASFSIHHPSVPRALQDPSHILVTPPMQ